MIGYYSPNNLRAILPFVQGTPKWLVLGGPADAGEAATAVKLWPSIRIVGIEPNPEAVKWQMENGWRRQDPMFQAALTDKNLQGEELTFETGRLRNASLHADDSPSRTTLRVTTTTLDAIEDDYGPFDQSIIWLDIEGSELQALKGAKRLLASRRPWLFNVEMLSHVPGMMDELPQLLAAYGYRAVAEWNYSEDCRDRIFLRDDLISGVPILNGIPYVRNPEDPLLRILL